MAQQQQLQSSYLWLLLLAYARHIHAFQGVTTTPMKANPLLANQRGGGGGGVSRSIRAARYPPTRSARSPPHTTALQVNFFGNKARSQDFSTAYVPVVDFSSLQTDPITCDPDFPCTEGDDETMTYRAAGSSRDLFFQDFWMVIGIPILTPFVAFLTFENVSHSYQGVVEFLSTKTWVAVDGGELQNKLLTPTVNGLVVPAVALLFATLTSTTITTLRQRQVEIRRAINMEAGELRAIECLLDSIVHGPVQDQCREYLIQYTSRILAECHPRNGTGDDVINPRRSFDSELNGFIRHLNNGHGDVIPGHVADECYASVARLREQRVTRITALQSVYPTLHYAILVALAVAECVSFLMETDLQVLVFLNSFQLKTLWSMMVGTFVACFAVFWDLQNPFSGSYQISPSVDQLHTIRLTLQASRVLSATAAAKQQLQTNGNGGPKKANGVKVVTTTPTTATP